VRVRSALEVEIRLEERLPIYPSLLTDVTASLVRESENGDFLGTGPFRVHARERDRILLVPYPDFVSAHAPNLDELEFRTGLGPLDVAAQFRAGELDIARGIADEDAERVARDTRLRASLVESAHKETCFVL